jgi:hypothetical protein
LTECVVGTYPALTDAEGVEMITYTRGAANAGQTRGAGGFNASNNFEAGRRQELYISTNGPFPTVTDDANGFMCDSVNVPDNRFGIYVADFTMTAATAKPRVSPNKLYRARYHTTSHVATGQPTNNNLDMQSYLRWRLQTAGAVFNTRLEILGARRSDAAAAVEGPASVLEVNLCKQASPGAGSQNPDFDPTIVTPTQDGGWYTVMMNTPLDGDIRGETPGTIAAKMPNLSAEPGPGVNVADSYKNISVGYDIIKLPTTLAVPFTFAFCTNPQNANMRVEKMRLTEHDQIDDGGYAY